MTLSVRFRQSSHRSPSSTAFPVSIDRPGAISFKGRSLLGGKPNEIAADGIARTFQRGEIPPHLSVLEAVQCGRHAMYQSSVLAGMFRLASFRREEETHRAAVLAILRLAEIEVLADAQVGCLAFGTQKIIGVARALAACPVDDFAGSVWYDHAFNREQNDHPTPFDADIELTEIRRR